MGATFLSFLRSGWLSDLPLRLGILTGLTSFAVAIAMAWPFLLHWLYYWMANSLYSVLVVTVIFGLIFSLFAPLVIGQKNVARVRAWSWQLAIKMLLWTIKVGFLLTVNTAVLWIGLFVAAISPGEVAPKAGDAITHFLERSADNLLHP